MHHVYVEINLLFLLYHKNLIQKLRLQIKNSAALKMKSYYFNDKD